MRRSPILGWLLVTFVAPVAHAADIDFDGQIQPILKRHCTQCHGPAKQAGQLRLDAAAHVRAGGVAGPILIAGKPSQSSLWKRIVAKDPDERMPLDKPPLSPKELTLIRRWILAGAKLPAAAGVSPLQNHWSYKPPKQARLPSVQNKAWPQNAIDYFILAKLEAHRLPPSPPVHKARLLRRVFLDLIGLPPTAQQVDAFLKDKHPQAYERMVDRLLASPHYGERWARPWLDLARYADSNGYQADQYRNVWPYRDWVIRSMNSDKPFDQFTIEQIAGDLLTKTTVSQRVATGFHRLTTCNVEAGVDPEENRVNQVIDRVNTTGTVWLATSIGCSQCHNHKYDPFSQREYYQLFAFFNNTPLEVSGNGVTYNFVGPKMELPLSKDQRERAAQLKLRLKNLDEQRKQLRRQLLGKNRFTAWQLKLRSKLQTGKPPGTPPAIVRIVKLPGKRRTPAQRQRLIRFYLSKNTQWKKLAQRRQQLNVIIAKLAPTTTLVMVEDKPRTTRVLKRGNFKTPGENVTPQTPRILPSFAGRAPNRLGLARWIVDKKNPLTARVAVNRWWSEIFGKGLVATSEDFGRQGDPPTHPQLLDYLAVELMKSDWSMKRVHRLLVTSAMYKQDSRITRRALKLDPENRWLGRAPRYRLPAETIRDNALVISNQFSSQMAGPPIYPPQPAGVWRHVGRNAPKYSTNRDGNRYRRGIYVIWRRSAPYPSFTVFDAPDRAACVVQRPRTNTPLQALTLMNDQAYVELARAFAHHVLSKTRSLSIRQRLQFAFRSCVIRQPTAKELTILERIYQQQRRRADELTRQQLRQLSGQATKQPRELAAWFLTANVLLNLDEVITRN